MPLIIIKILVSIFFVLGLVFVSERSPKIGGLLIGLPLGAGILIFFYGLEQSIDFVTQSIPYAIAGLISTLAFGVGFYLGGKFFLKKPILHVLSALFGGLAGFLGIGFLLSLLKIDLFTGILIFLLGMVFAIIFFRHVPESKNAKPKKFTLSTLIFRALFVVAIVLAITGTAQIIGVKWAGIMASFPTNICPLLIILAYTYKNEIYPSVLKHFSYSVTTLLVFYLSVLWLFPRLGIYYGILAVYLICFSYLYLLSKFPPKK